MKKLNKKKIIWIVRELERREIGVYTTAGVQNITPKHARRVDQKYKNDKDPCLKKCRRKPLPITDEERQIVIKAYNEIRTGATMIEQYLDEKGIHINLSRIHAIMLEAKLAKEEIKKKYRRSEVRYERKHSLSLDYSNWFEFDNKQVIIFIDDASRFITGYGEFDNANTENSIKVYKQSLKFGLPKLVHTDHGPQFFANEQEGKKTGLTQNRRGAYPFLINTPRIRELKEMEDYRNKEDGSEEDNNINNNEDNEEHAQGFW